MVLTADDGTATDEPTPVDDTAVDPSASDTPVAAEDGVAAEPLMTAAGANERSLSLPAEPSQFFAAPAIALLVLAAAGANFMREQKQQ